MNINFATTNKVTAKKYLLDKRYDFLSKKMKAIILDNLGDNCRVQDPDMYEKPMITIFSQEIADLINA